ncbi:myosin-2 heavy chain-like isoform X4 [Bolinopsis microptera]|uniref:myosin-2 heavy chain-like isoform X4 n=1 Tax=Bolinopsis microptera TaxID=2820187 RepID=UPI00307A47F6
MQMPKVIFIPCARSHRFERREIEVFEEVKVGRSVARCKTSPDNAIFDCKVLSRSHAVLWYQDGSIWIKDTASSNGTFINNTRLSRGGEESEPFRISSGDEIQFGVDVMEAKKKDGGNPITHGCIIAKATVIIPDVMLPNPNYVINNPMLNSRSLSSSSETLNNIDEDQDILELHAAIKNAVNRENLLHTRLQELEGRLGIAIEAAELGWQALIKEDKLLARIELLENQLEIFTRNPTEDQNKIIQLENEKHDYQIHAKDSLRAICLEKSDVGRKCADLENLLTTARIEVSHHKNLHESTQAELIKVQDELRKRTTELETKEAEFKNSLETTEVEHKEAMEELNKKLEEMTQSNTELKEQRSELEKQLEDVAQVHEAQITSLQSDVDTLKTSLESADEKKAELEAVVEKNEFLKNENYRLEEELIKLREEVEAGTASSPNTTVVVETETKTTSCEVSVDIQFSEASTNTEPNARDPGSRELSNEDQENQMNTVNIKDSMSQTEKWFDAISPSSSKSDIFSSSFTAGDKRYRSLRQGRREGPRPWSNSNAFEGSIAHAMALIESLDDIKSSCVKFREETERDGDDVELSLGSASEELSVTDDSKSDSKPDINTTISPPPKRRNSYREACEEEELDTMGTTTLRVDDPFDDTSEADEQYELAPEDHPGASSSSVILNKVESASSSPRPDQCESPINRQGNGMESRLQYYQEALESGEYPALVCSLLEFGADHWHTLSICWHLATTFSHSHLRSCDLRVSRGLPTLTLPDLGASAEHLRASSQDLVAARDKAGILEKDLESKQQELDGITTKLSELKSRVDELESAEKDHLEKLDDRKAEIDSLKREISRLKTVEEEHERLKAENARQSEETARKNEVATLNATITTRDNEISILKKQVDDFEKANSVSKKVLKTLQVDVDELEARLAKKDNEKAELTRSFSEDFEAELEKERARHDAELQKQVGDIEAKLNEKEKQLEALIAELNEAKAEQENSSRMESELDTLQKQIESLTGRPTSEDMAEVESQLAAMTEALEKKEDELIEMTAMHNITIRDNKDQLETLEAEVLRLSDALKDANGAKESFEDENEELEKELAAAKQDAEQKVSELREQLNLETNEAKTAAKTAADQCLSLSSEVELLTKELAVSKEDAEQELAELHEQLNLESDKTKIAADSCLSLSSEVELLTKELAVSKEDCENLLTKNKAASEFIVELQNDLKAADEEKTSLEHEHDKLKEQLAAVQLEASEKSNALEATIAALQTELNNMKNSQVSAISDAESEISEKSEELAVVQSENESLEAEKEILMVEKEEKSELLAAALSDNESLESEKDVILGEKENLESASAELQSEVETYKKDLEALAESHHNLQLQIQSLQGDHSKLNEDLVTLQEQLAKASSERDAALTELDSAREEMNLKIEEEVLKKSAEIVVEQEQVKTLTSSLSEYEGQIAGYKSKLEEMQKLADQLDSVNAELTKSQAEANSIRQKYDELDGKAERTISKNEKELKDLKAALNKATKEAVSNQKETKRSKDQLLNVKANLKETQDKLTRISKEKKTLQVQLNTPPTTPSPPPATVTENGDIQSLDKIKSLENQIKDLKKQKESKKALAEPSPKEQSQTGVMMGAIGLAGVSSALSAYIATLYGC